MIVWLILIVYLFFIRIIMGPCITQKSRKVFLILAGIGIVFVMGSRFPQYKVVYDLEIYYHYYGMARKLSWIGLFKYSRFEPGYAIMNKIVSTLVPWDQFILYFEAAFCVGCTFSFIHRNTEDVFLGVLVYVLLGSMGFQLTAFRQAFAMSICLLSVEKVKQRKFIPFLLMVLLAASMHKVAIVFLPAYYILRRPINRKENLLSMIIICLSPFFAKAATMLGNQVLHMNYEGYIGNEYGGLVPILIYFIIIIYSYITANRLDNRVGLNMLIPGLAIYLMRYTTVALERVSFFYTIGAATALPEALRAEKDGKIKVFLKIFAAVLLIMLFIYRLTYAEYANYRFFWE